MHTASSGAKGIEKKRILFLANHFITLFSFRKEMIQVLVRQGHELYISLPASAENQYFTDLGCKVIETRVDRRGVNPLKDIKLFFCYKRLISQIDPDIIFSFTIKPNIYGTLASNRLRRKDKTKYKQVCNITGTGATFLKETFVSKICKMLYRHSVKKCYKVLFQNSGDRDFFIQNGMVADNWEMLPGSGVNLAQYTYAPLPEGDTVRFLFIGRVMQLKGIDTYLEAAKQIKETYPNTVFYIAGWNEEEAYKQKVAAYANAGYVQYLGFQRQITQWLEKCHCTVLPSLGGEGVPNVLLESAAMGRVCIGSSIAGTCDVIEDGKTGYLFEAGDTGALVDAIRKFLACSPEQKMQMGKNGREKVAREFDRQIVIDKYCDEARQA